MQSLLWESMKPWLQRQLKEPIVFLQVPFPQASLSHSFMSRRKKGQRETPWLKEKDYAIEDAEKQLGLQTFFPRRLECFGWWHQCPGEAEVRVYTLEIECFLTWHMGGGKMRTCKLYRNFILFASQILHPCHSAQIFSLENGKTSVCIWTVICHPLWHTSAFRNCTPSYPKVVTHRLCSAISNRTPLSS